jgi:hypothetical protein
MFILRSLLKILSPSPVGKIYFWGFFLLGLLILAFVILMLGIIPLCFVALWFLLVSLS